MIIKEIDISLKPFEIFNIFKNENLPVFLDSSDKYEKLGKYSIIAFNPFITIKSKNGKVNIKEDDGEINLNRNPFVVIKEYLDKFNKTYNTDLPFIGGAIGHFSYDLLYHLETIDRTAVDDVNIEDLNLGFYNGAIIYEHSTKKVFITDSDVNIGGDKRVNIILKKLSYDKTEKLNLRHHNKKAEIKSNMTKEEYLKSIEKIKNYIIEGDIYQVNMTQRFKTDLRDKPIELYNKLRNINPAPFAAFMDYGEYQILSSSPERFIELRDNKLQTRPIKGTRPRGNNDEEDKKLKNELKESLKDKAELLMIVDLERNDFSKVAKTSTVKVPELFVVEKYPTVFHLVSTVTCLKDDKFDTIDCITNTFPGGSITGAPKIRAMEIIDELEPTQRNIYTGSIGYIDFNGDMDLNIVIRTMVIKNDKVYFQVGGGIVYDSNALDEYQESLDKAKALIEALNY
ncbi:aminodeoxychorismate synthase component I [Clostridiaceae bacterium HSG29]|nr:aminodeoxychorismate synthase component I [Clostridiaceae bacterium HSG29]